MDYYPHPLCAIQIPGTDKCFQTTSTEQAYLSKLGSQQSINLNFSPAHQIEMPGCLQLDRTLNTESPVRRTALGTFVITWGNTTKKTHRATPYTGRCLCQAGTRVYSGLPHVLCCRLQTVSSGENIYSCDLPPAPFRHNTTPISQIQYPGNLI